MWTIEQNGDAWDVHHDGALVSSHGTYTAALAVIAGQLAAGDSSSSPGVLPERWTSTTGIAFNEQPDPERDFTSCEWSFRDPAVYPLPLMLQTSTEMGHFGAELAGFMDVVGLDPNPTGSGGFYDSDRGRQFRDMLASGMRFGVSVDPGDLEVEFVCTDQDDDGWCNEGVYSFLAYQIIGLTGTPFPAFANATIELAGAAPADDQTEDDDSEGEDAEAVTASASYQAVATRRRLDVATPTPEQVAEIVGSQMAAPVQPPRAWFTEPEPEVGDERLVEQEDGSLACPLTITPEGQVYGHLARWGQCHVANPGGPNLCVTPPEDDDEGYSGFRVASVLCDDGTEVPTGPLIAGCDHPSVRLSAAQARDAYAHNGVAWGDVSATVGQFGPWLAGALRPELSPLQVRVLRASALSGDWRETTERPGVLSLIAALATNVPGFPVTRSALVASAGFDRMGAATTAARSVNGRVVALVASGVVSPCPECARRQRDAIVAAGGPNIAAELAAIRHELAVINRRTRHLNGAAAASLMTRVSGS